MQVEQWPLNKFIEYINNPRNNDQAVDKVASAINEFGFRVPIVAKSDGTLIDGHLRLKAAKKLNLETVPVLLADDLTDAQVKAFRISVNQVATIAEWDLDKLKIEIEGLGELDFDVELLGFDDDFLDGLLDVQTDGLTDEDSVPELPETPVSVLGDIWQLGNHRLMCGDSTSIDAVEKLMDGHKADMVFTDPPYNVAVKGKFTGAIKNDDLSDSDFQELLDGVASIIYQFNKGSSYIAYEIKNHTQFECAFSVVGEVDEIIVWNKDSASFYSDDKYNRKFEAILFIKGEGMLNCKAETNVWDYAKSSSFNSRDENGKRFNEKGNFLVAHPTTKPVKLVERALTNSSRKQDFVFDTFGGSGSTLIACEKLERQARLMELDEKYVDVIINRWQEFTGKLATHIESGKTYEELKGDRDVTS